MHQLDIAVVVVVVVVVDLVVDHNQTEVVDYNSFYNYILLSFLADSANVIHCCVIILLLAVLAVEPLEPLEPLRAVESR